MDWRLGALRSRIPPSPGAEVVIAGDWAPIRDFADIIDSDAEAVYGDLLPRLREADLRIVNLECPLADCGTPMVKSGTVLRGNPGHIKGLTAVPFEAAALGNNHVFDYGVAAFEQTCDLLAAHRIRHLGAGLSAKAAWKPLVMDIRGLRIGIVNFSEGEDLTAARADRPGVAGWEIERVAAIITELRPLVDGLIAICHGGLEYIPFPPPYVAEALQRVAAAGADLVIGHHPHVPQGVAIHGGVPICYSLGNFVFFQPTDLLYRKIGYLVKARFTSRGLAGLNIVPYEILNPGLALLTGRKHHWFLKQLAALSAPLADFDRLTRAWHGFLDYCGQDGLSAEVGGILRQLEQDPAKGAAMLRNRLTTRQHRHHWLDMLTRLMAGQLNTGPKWARSWAETYFTCKSWPF